MTAHWTLLGYVLCVGFVTSTAASQWLFTFCSWSLATFQTSGLQISKISLHDDKEPVSISKVHAVMTT